MVRKPTRKKSVSKESEKRARLNLSLTEQLKEEAELQADARCQDNVSSYLRYLIRQDGVALSEED